MSKARYFALALVTALSLGADQLAKVWARATLRPIYPHVKTVIPGYWDFRYSENTGAAFGMLGDLPGAHLVFVGFALAFAVGATIYLGRARLRHPVRVAVELGLVVGGALGNAFDRVAFGRVTDFVVWHIGHHEWHTFNVADATLVVGIIGLFFDSGRARADGSPAGKPGKAKPA